MKRALTVLLVLGTLLCFAGDKRKQKQKDVSRRVDIADVVVHRDEKLITVDGRVRNTGEKALRKLVLILKFVAPDGVNVTTQRGVVEDAELEPGRDSEFKWQLRDDPRAVEVTFSAMDYDERELTVEHPGPYAIE